LRLNGSNSSVGGKKDAAAVPSADWLVGGTVAAVAAVAAGSAATGRVDAAAFNPNGSKSSSGKNVENESEGAEEGGAAAKNGSEEGGTAENGSEGIGAAENGSEGDGTVENGSEGASGVG